MSAEIRTIATLLAGCRRVVVLTGAGVSAESGIPTFRDALSGLWEKFSPEELATPEAFDHDPQTVYAWYQWRRRLVADCLPNAGHYALATLAKQVNKLVLITQNVDGLHQRAGSTEVIEFHGNLLRNRCQVEATPLDVTDLTSDQPPRCPDCGALARPDVVWFGEALDPLVLAKSQEEARRCDVFISTGTSSLVYPAADLAYKAQAGGATLIEINPEQTPLTPYCQYALHGPSAHILPQIVTALTATT